MSRPLQAHKSISMTAFLLTLFLVGAVVTANKPRQKAGTIAGAKGAPCMPPIHKNYITCMIDAKWTSQSDDTKTAACETKLKDGMSDCGLATSANAVRGEKGKATNGFMAKCGMRTDACKQQLKYIQMRTDSLSDLEIAKDKGKLLSAAPEVVAEKMTACMKAALGDQAKKDACISNNATKALAMALGRTPTKTEVKDMVNQGAIERTGDIMALCYLNATSDAEKNKCNTDQTILDACTSARGGLNCTVADLKRAAQAKAKREMDNLLKGCMDLAGSNKAAINSCRKSNEAQFREKLAEATGKKVGDIKDATVKKLQQDSGKDAVRDSLKMCTGNDRTLCQKAAKDAFARALGKDIADITDTDLKRASQKASAKDLMNEMKACMEDAADSNARKACATTSAKSALKKTSLGGTEPSEGKVKLFLKKGAEEAVKTTRFSCSNATSSTCKTSVERAIAASLGKQISELKNVEVKRIVLKGSLSNAVEEARACAQAKKDKTTGTASCKKPIDAFVETAGETKPTGSMLSTKKMNVAKNAMKAAQTEAKLVCLEEADKAAVKSCLEEATADLDDVAGVLLEDVKDQEKRAKKKVQASKRATVSVVGESLRGCMEAASEKSAGQVAAAKTACLDEVKTQLDKLGDAESADDVLKKFRANIMTGAKDCDASDQKNCRSDAKAEAIASGMEAREYQQTKRLAEIKGAAETYADCKDGGSDDAICSEQAKATYLGISGAASAQYDSAKDKIERLGKKLADGAVTKLVPRDSMAVAVATDGTVCNDGAKSDFSQKVSEKAKAANPKLGASSAGKCRVVDGKAEYSTTVTAKGMSADDIDAASKNVAQALNSLSISTSRRRRQILGTITATEAYASQESELCAEGDTACDGTAPSDTTTSGGSAHAPLSFHIMLMSTIAAIMILCF
jgi:hypothetical protein